MTKFMTEFRSDFLDPIPHAISDSDASLPSGGTSRRPLHILMLGSKNDIESTIKSLHQYGFSEAKAWSKIIPCPNAAETLAQLRLAPLTNRCVSILTRYFTS